MVKFTIVLRRKPGTTHEEFVDHHRNRHAPLFTSLPEVQANVRRYVQCHAVGAALPGMPDSKIDGTTELWFDDVAGIAAVFASPNYLATIRPDEERFLDLHACEFLIGTEHPVIGSGS